MGPIVYAETSARNCHYTLRDNPEERLSVLRILKFVFNYEAPVKDVARIVKEIAHIFADYIKHKGY
jgi:hypothetical protein